MSEHIAMSSRDRFLIENAVPLKHLGNQEPFRQVQQAIRAGRMDPTNGAGRIVDEYWTDRVPSDSLQYDEYRRGSGHPLRDALLTERCQSVRTAFFLLTDLEQEIVLRFVVHEESMYDIAAALALSLRVTHSIRSRALHRMRSVLSATVPFTDEQSNPIRHETSTSYTPRRVSVGCTISTPDEDTPAWALRS